MTRAYAYEQVASRFGAVGLVWAVRRDDADSVLSRVQLPLAGVAMNTIIAAWYPGAVERPHAAFTPIGSQIGRFLAGEGVEFSFNGLDLASCGIFQRRVLRLAFQIPRGRVSSYGRMAERLGQARAARAVGGALAGNPFPIVIPCHRIVRADGSLGGFGGGREMKRALLEMEGVAFDDRDRVEAHHLWP